LGIQTRDLLFYAAIRVCDHHRRVFLGGIVVSWRIDIRSNLDAVQIVFHRMNVDLTFDIFSNGTVINEGERIFLVISRLD